MKLRIPVLIGLALCSSITYTSQISDDSDPKDEKEKKWSQIVCKKFGGEMESKAREETIAKERAAFDDELENYRKTDLAPYESQLLLSLKRHIRNVKKLDENQANEMQTLLDGAKEEKEED